MNITRVRFATAFLACLLCACASSPPPPEITSGTLPLSSEEAALLKTIALAKSKPRAAPAGPTLSSSSPLVESSRSTILSGGAGNALLLPIAALDAALRLGAYVARESDFPDTQSITSMVTPGSDAAFSALVSHFRSLGYEVSVLDEDAVVSTGITSLRTRRDHAARTLINDLGYDAVLLVSTYFSLMASSGSAVGQYDPSVLAAVNLYRHSKGGPIVSYTTNIESRSRTTIFSSDAVSMKEHGTPDQLALAISSEYSLLPSLVLEKLRF